MDDQANIELEKLLRNAGRELMRYWPGSSDKDSTSDLKTEKKNDGSLVTSADFASNEILLEGLNALFPEDAILSEEVPERHDLDSHKRIWIIDPLDGTHHFAAGKDDFSILVGLCERGSFVEGYMYFPAQDYFLCAKSGQSTTLNGEGLSVSNVTEPRKGKVYTRHFQYEGENWSLGEPLDSGMAFFCLCAGQLDGVVIRMNHHQIWDIAAPSVAVLGAGGYVTNERGERLNYAVARGGLKYLVASNGSCHQALLNELPEMV